MNLDLMSIEDIIKYDKQELKNIRFIFAPEFERPDKYFSVKIHQLHGSNIDEIIISISDCSHFILYNNEKNHNVI